MLKACDACTDMGQLLHTVPIWKTFPTFYNTHWYYEYRETIRHGLTADSRLQIAMDGLQTWIIVQTLWTDADQILGSAHLC